MVVCYASKNLDFSLFCEPHSRLDYDIVTMIRGYERFKLMSLLRAEYMFTILTLSQVARLISAFVLKFLDSQRI